MDENQKEEVLQAIEGAANFMRGVSFDPSVPAHIKEALANKTSELESVVEKYID